MNEMSGTRGQGIQAQLSVPLAQAVFCVLDTETTGFQPGVDAVLEVAGVRTSLAEGILHRESWLVNPGRPIPADATEIHGIRDEDVAGAGSLEDALGRLYEQPFDAWVAHNAAFDFGFVQAGDIPVVCTLRIARRLWPELPSHKNQSLRDYLKLQVDGADGLPAHRAEPDALVTTALLRFELLTLQERFPGISTLGEFLEWLETPFLLPQCNFGSKHRGRPWSEVPRSYIAWALENFDNIDPDLEATMRFHLKA